MKKIKSVLALLLAAVMILSFAGCAKETIGFGNKEATDEELIVGSWVCEMDLTTYMNENMGELGLEGFEMTDTPLFVYVAFDFDEDGTCALYVDEDATLESMTVYIDDMMDAMVEYMYVALEDELGMTRDEIDEFYNEYMGMSVAEYFDAAMEEYLTPETLSESFDSIETSEGYYKLDNGKLYIADTEEELETCEEYTTYAFENGNLVIDAGNSSDDFEAFEKMGVELPLVFEKR